MSGSTTNAKATLIPRVALFFLSPLFFSAFFPWLAAAMATLLVACSIDVAAELNWSSPGPGLTFDECFNIEVGQYLVESFYEAGLASFHPQTQLDIYKNPSYNPDHPPLGRIALGISSRIIREYTDKDIHRGYFVSAARLASACEFGLLILLIGVYTRRWFGPLVSFYSVLAVICMPRLFGHAHLASLETCTCLTYTVVILVLANRWSQKSSPSIKTAFVPGIFLGLVLLTKIHGILLFPVITVWGLWNWKFKAVLPLLALFSIAFVVFFVGWPWLWIDPIEHLQEYFGRATERASLNCYYLGQKYADTDVPWHYPIVMLVVTMPLGFLFSGVLALLNRTGDENSQRTIFDQRTQLILGAFLIPLIVFAIPGVTVYDGVRLFLMCFPLFAVFVGLGMKRIFEALQRRNGNFVAYFFIVACFVGPIYNIVTLRPCYLSYYSELVGGLWKAEELGFERTYWGDSVTPEFLEEVLREIPPNAIIEVAPVLHPLQLHFMEHGSWFKNRPDLTLSGYDHNRNNLSRYVLVIRRKADPWSSLTPPPSGTKTLHSVTRQGVSLTEMYLLPLR